MLVVWNSSSKIFKLSFGLAEDGRRSFASFAGSALGLVLLAGSVTAYSAQITPSKSFTASLAENSYARQTETLLANSTTDGIPKDLIYFPQIQAAREAQDWTNYKKHLAAGLQRYAELLQRGLIADKEPDWHIDDDTISRSSFRSALFSEGSDTQLPTPAEMLEQQRPRHAQYQRLQKVLKEYKAVNAANLWPTLATDIPELRAGDRHKAVAELRNRLRLSGDFTAYMQADPHYFSANLAKALSAFQTRHGLLADGVLESTTLRVLNISLEDRITQIELSLERWRWLPQSLGSSYVWVSLAGGYLELIEDNQKTLELKAIAGRPYRATPSLQSTLRRLDLNPTWTVPRSIAVEDLLPLQKKNPNFLETKGIEVFSGRGEKQRRIKPDDIDWSKLHTNNFPYWLKQRPGPENSMGKIKFFINNPFDIFLHDTPATTLFQLPNRTFSSGCVRLDKPLELARKLLGAEHHPATDRLTQIVNRQVTESVRLRKSVPVYLVYMTAWVDDNGTVQFRSDAYGRDAALKKKWKEK